VTNAWDLGYLPASIENLKANAADSLDTIRCNVGPDLLNIPASF
jgi:hypothetical protein